MSHDENACLKCGRCCRMRMVIRGEVFVLPWSRCRHYDERTKLCAIYDTRFETRPECLTVEQGIVQRAYPQDCPYVKAVPNYRAPVEVKSVEEAIAYTHWW